MSWEKLEGAARHLNDLADGLTAEILGLEQRLRGLHLGVSHWLDHPLDDGSGSRKLLPNSLETPDRGFPLASKSVMNYEIRMERRSSCFGSLG